MTQITPETTEVADTDGDSSPNISGSLQTVETQVVHPDSRSDVSRISPESGSELRHYDLRTRRVLTQPQCAELRGYGAWVGEDSDYADVFESNESESSNDSDVPWEP